MPTALETINLGKNNSFIRGEWGKMGQFVTFEPLESKRLAETNKNKRSYQG